MAGFFFEVLFEADVLYILYILYIFILYSLHKISQRARHKETLITHTENHSK